MSPIATTPTRFIGCDVGKQTIVIFDSASGQTRSVPNRKADLTRLARSLDETCLVVCEATGGYENCLLETMLAAGRAAHRADARKIKAFIWSFGTLGKTDAIDARALAQYGEERHRGLARWQAPDLVRQEIQALVLLRADLVRTRQAQRNRLAAPGLRGKAAVVAIGCLRAMVRAVQGEIATIEKRLRALISSHPELCRDEAMLRGIMGVGPATAATLLALMPELGRISGKQATCLAGVAPHRRLVARGKKPIVADAAVMRKLIVIANAKLRDARIDGANQVS